MNNNLSIKSNIPGFKMFHQNINSLTSTTDSPEITLDKIIPEILIITEYKIKAYVINRINVLN